MVGDREIRRKLKELMKDRSWSVEYTAKILGMARNTLENVLDEYAIMGWALKTRDKVKRLLQHYERN